MSCAHRQSRLNFGIARRATSSLCGLMLVAGAAGPAIAAGCALRGAGRGPRRRCDRCAQLSARGWPRGPACRHRAGAAEKPPERTPPRRCPRSWPASEVTLRGADDTPDRYGRQPALVYLAILRHPGAGSAAVAGRRAGFGHVTDKDCAAVLTTAEAAARQAKRGTWADPAAIKNTESPGDILAGIGRFIVVEGKVLSVRQAGATTYLNFGRNWTRGFAVTISRRMMPAFEAAGIVLKSLENRRIRVRGWVEARGGPRIEALRVGQIELLGEN